MPPRLVIVKQPPCSSSSGDLARAGPFSGLRQLDRQLDDVLLVDVAQDRHEQAAVRVHGHADVHVVLEDDLLGRHVDRRVELREALQRRGHDLQGDRRHRELAAGGFRPLGEARTQLLEVRDVGLVALRDVRHREPRPAPGARRSCVAPRASACARSRPTSRNPAALPAPGRRARAAVARGPPEDMTFFTWALTSSAEMRPPGPVPATWLTSTPSSRATRRTDGAAGAGLRRVLARRHRHHRARWEAPVVPRRRLGSRLLERVLQHARLVFRWCRRRGGRARDVRAPAAACTRCTVHAAAVMARHRRRRDSMTNTTSSTMILAPSLTRTSMTRPSTEDGTSMVALSVSSSSSG